MSRPTADQSKLARALTGITQGSVSTRLPPFSSPLMSKLMDPPTYVVQMLLCGVAGLEWSRGDKAAWEVGLDFKNVPFTVSDWRRSTWSIYCSKDTRETRRVAEELQRKLGSAGRLLNQMLRPEFANQVDGGEFYIKNSFRFVWRPYEHFRELLESELSKLEDTRNPEDQAMAKTASSLSDQLNTIIRMEEVVSHTASAMIAFFFSYTELLFDVLFAFADDRGISYLEFRQLTWAERFKRVLPVSTDRGLSVLYNRLLAVKRTTRDVVFHGYGGEPALLVPSGNFGLVPVSYEVLTDSVLFSWIPVGQSDAREMLDSCQTFDDWVESDDRAWYAYKYAESCFEIPFGSTSVQRVKSWMASRDDFLAALEEKGIVQDHLMEQY